MICRSGSKGRREHVKRGAVTVLLAQSVAMACGCGRDGTAPQLSLLRVEPAKVKYSPGDSLTVTLSNLGSVSIRYSGCDVVLERLDGESWTRVTESPNCGDVAHELANGASVDIRVSFATPDRNLPISLGNGVYRCAFMEVERLTDSKAGPVASAPFLVVPRP